MLGGGFRETLFVYSFYVIGSSFRFGCIWKFGELSLTALWDESENGKNGTENVLIFSFEIRYYGIEKKTLVVAG